MKNRNTRKMAINSQKRAFGIFSVKLESVLYLIKNKILYTNTHQFLGGFEMLTWFELTQVLEALGIRWCANVSEKAITVEAVFPKTESDISEAAEYVDGEKFEK